MTIEKLTEQRDGQNVIALRQDGKRRWAIASAGMGEKSTRFLYGEYADKLAEYESIGTPEECRAAVEKQTAKKPDYEGDGYSDGHLVYDTWICPCCGKHYEVDYDDYDFCPECGQCIDWSEEE